MAEYKIRADQVRRGFIIRIDPVRTEVVRLTDVVEGNVTLGLADGTSRVLLPGEEVVRVVE